MKFFLFLTLVIILAASAVFSQNRKAPTVKTKRAAKTVKRAKTSNPPKNSAVPLSPVEPDEPSQTAKGATGKADDKLFLEMLTRLAAEKPPPSSNVLKETTIGKWGAASLTLPEDLTNVEDGLKTRDDEKLQWTEFTRSWKQAGWGIPSALEVELSLKVWNVEIKKIAGELPQGMRTPAELVQFDLHSSLKEKQKPGSLYKEVKMMKIDGFDGSFARTDVSDNPKRFIITWLAYRYYENKLQKVFLLIEGEKDELAKALKIMESLKLEAEK